ncbi:MAG: hypothetical protein II987_05810 [Clostridia bacterium]|nr:hypothetical protein [Clostridia bacterium]
MKRLITLILFPLLLCSSCIDPYDLPLKTYKSESPYIYISQTSLCGGKKGEIENENGETVEVIVEFFHGEFYIWKYVSDDELGEELLRGDFRYREKENVLIFYLDNGDEIILTPVEETSE